MHLYTLMQKNVQLFNIFLFICVCLLDISWITKALCLFHISERLYISFLVIASVFPFVVGGDWYIIIGKRCDVPVMLSVPTSTPHNVLLCWNHNQGPGEEAHG
jgi:hypothetical protein